MQVAKHRVVEIDYKLTDDNGRLLDRSDEGQPLAYLHGVGAIIPGLESALEGKIAGDQVQVSVPPADAYGERNETLLQQLPRSQFKDVDELAVGMQFRVPTDKEQLVITVVEVGDQSVTVDGNHPLAGTTLNFDVNVNDVRDASAEEIAHGHAHGAGGHHH